MNEENSNIEEPNNEDLQAPPLPEEIQVERQEPPEMSEVATLANIFFEPGRTFEDLRKKPRFILAGLIIILLATVSSILFIEKIGFRNITAARLEASSQVQQMAQEDKDKLIDQQSSDVVKYITYGATPIVLIVVFLVGGLIYWGATNAFGGDAKFTHGVAVWVYSSFPITVLAVIANLIVLFIKSPDDISPTQAQTGLVQLNPGFLVDGKESPALLALLSSIDLFAIWGYILAIIGLKTVGKISYGSATAIVLILALILITLRVVGALVF